MRERMVVVQGDITKQQVDAIVNAAISSLRGGGGVDGAIHAAAGQGLYEECRTLGGCPTGQAKITGGYNLPTKHVIHAVGPQWFGGGYGEDELLAGAYRASLGLAEAHQCRSVAFPAISTGIYRFPLERATRIAVDEVRRFLEAHGLPERVVFVCYSPETVEMYERILNEMSE